MVDAADWSLRFHRRLLAGDRFGAKSVIEASLTSGTDPVGVYVDVVAPAMRRIGDGWAAGAIGVAEEHRAAVIVGQVLAVLDSRFSRRSGRRGLVLAGAVEGERHSLPLRMVADVVRLSGYEVQDLGADVRERSGVPVLVGGAAVPDAATSAALGGDGWAADARGAVELLEERLGFQGG
ncbi:B12-binding domain-containing protein [Acidimicrobiia bacterium EGI L10123]|uniref:cobalamin B12-binding domain-containing protein n=1 Tax=Salinilacustrithrix flava TaxID=2957203 RepID=UPI003D7C1A28|nr:B12-binding domain-containing protein [Acidimicrobiia bacterium EGI L10123]